MNKKFLLIFPRPISEMPTGFAYLNTVLKSKGYECKALVNTFKKYFTQEELYYEIKKYNPLIIGFNLGTLGLLETYDIVKKLHNEGYFMIAGGPHATTCPDEVLNNGIDIVVRNEGEETLSELCEFWEGKKDILNIKGISFKNHHNKITHNAQRPYVDFNKLPKPDFSCFNYDHFKTSDGLLKGLHRIYCSRGCPGSCTFCDNAIFGKHVRYRPLDDVIKEIDFRNKNYGIESFIIADDTFTANKNYVKDFCKEIKKLNSNIIWGCSTRANAVDKEILKCMKDAGCYLIGFGIESADPGTLKLIHKHVTVEQASKAIKLSSSIGLRVYVNLMVGFPWETIESITNDIRFIKNHFNDVFIYQVSGSLIPYPETEIYIENKDKYDIKDWWLRPNFQNYGIQVHQNTKEPYKHSTYYQRHLYNDTYIWEDTFFNYTKEYKEKVKEMAFLIGKRNLLSEESSILKRKLILYLSFISRKVYELNKHIEKTIISKIMDIFYNRSTIHDGMPLGAILKLRK